MYPAHLSVDIEVMAIIPVEWVVDLEPGPSLSDLVVWEVPRNPGGNLLWSYPDFGHIVYLDT